MSPKKRQTKHTPVAKDLQVHHAPLRSATPQRQRVPQLSATLRLASAASVAFDVFTAVLSVVDVVSDVLVAYQFYTSPGQMVWFYMVAGSTFASNCIYAFMMLSEFADMRYGMTRDSRNLGKMVLLYVVCFPVAQAFPVLQWLSEHFPSPHMREAASRSKAVAECEDLMPREDSWTVKVNSNMHTVISQELAGDEDATQLLRMFHKGFEKHLRSHKGFYVETVVEAIPQLVVQLLAITVHGEATNVQMLSMCLSLVTIVSKAYVVSISLDLKSMLWKASLVAFDVFTTFFIFSTLVASNHGEYQTPTTFAVVPFAWSVTVSTTWLGSAWMQLLLWCVQLAVVTVTGFAIFNLVDMTIENGRPPLDELWAGLLFFAAVAVALIPCCIVFEGVKLSWVLLFMNVTDVNEAVPFFALAWRFVGRGYEQSHEEGMRRLKHFLESMIPVVSRHGDSALYNAAYYARCAEVNVKLNRLYVSNCRMPSHDDQLENVDWHTHPTWRIELFHVALRLIDPIHTRNLGERRRNCFMIFWGCLVFATVVVSVAFNLMFPLLHFALYGWSALNSLQAVCAVGACASLCIIVGFGHHAYGLFTFQFASSQMLLWQWNRPWLNPTLVSEIVVSYCRPPHARALQQAVHVGVLPFDVVVDEVASFMAPHDVDLHKLTTAQCAALKEAN